MFKYFILMLIPLILSFSGCTGQAKVPSDQYQRSLKAEVKFEGNIIQYKENLYKSTGGFRRVSTNDPAQLVELNKINNYEFYIDKDEIDFPTKIYVSILDDQEFYDVYKLETDF